METPMMRQYKQIKDEHPDCMLFFRLGDFYEMFGDDAVSASELLSLTLTTRDRSSPEDERVPMCGVPYHSAESYIARLIESGRSVAICEQTEDPAFAKGLVRREVVRVITPGTLLETGMLDETRNNFLVAVYWEGSGAGLCAADVSTGECFITEIASGDVLQSLLTELGRYSPREVLLSPGAWENGILVSFLYERIGAVLPVTVDSDFTDAEIKINTKWPGGEPDKLGINARESAKAATGALLGYLDKVSLGSTKLRLNVYEKNRYMELDLTARQNLEICQTMRSGDKKGSLLWVLDETKTTMGSRTLRSWLEKPLTNPSEINRRLYAVSELHSDTVTRGELRGAIKGMPDMERILSRAVFGSANARDLRAFCGGAKKLPEIRALMENLKSHGLRELYSAADPLDDIHNRLDSALTDDPPFSIREGGFIRDGYDAEVDRLRSLVSGAREAFAALEAEEKAKTGIKSLKIGYNKVFGYYIEVSKSYYGQVPGNYIRKQTLSNCERYITPELRELENDILSSGDKLSALESELFSELRELLIVNAHRIQSSASVVAELDTLCSFAEVAVKNRYTCPTVDYGNTLTITGGRHPVVEKMLDDGLFVPNDTEMNDSCRTAIITGPNMAGKSTYMRQVALITLMAQAGSFVPAQSAQIGVCDRIFTRIGAADDLAGGRSTFMLEMTEVADILRHSTDKSLIILDEVGRGTSTFDGMSVARAVLEHVHHKIRAKTLFATHYHELTEIEDELPGVKNFNVAVKKRGEEIIFLRRIVPGGADDSYGVEVARLAGLPEAVISRARSILNELETGENPRSEKSVKRKPAEPETQISLEVLRAQSLMAELQKLDVYTLTPIEALNVLAKLVGDAKNG